MSVENDSIKENKKYLEELRNKDAELDEAIKKALEKEADILIQQGDGQVQK